MKMRRWRAGIVGLLFNGLLVGAVCGQTGPEAGLPSTTATDSVRTNLWLTEALMGEITIEAIGYLAPAPASVRLVALSDGPSDDMFMAVASEILFNSGYDVFVAQDDSVAATPVDYAFSFSVQNIELSYPDVGRTLGIWQRWVARDIRIAVTVEISEADSGRLLVSDRIERRFGDRFDSDNFDDVNSDQYEFTTAETSESGWKSRTEEIVVLGTLVGLVAIYFANTGD